jgi:hypothetical protein
MNLPPKDLGRRTLNYPQEHIVTRRHICPLRPDRPSRKQNDRSKIISAWELHSSAKKSWASEREEELGLLRKCPEELDSAQQQFIVGGVV